MLIIIFSVGLLYGGDLFNQGTRIDLTTKALSGYDNASAYYETASTVTYIFKATWADSSDHYHSKPFFIGDCNDADAYVSAIVSAASDVNPIYHFSYDNCNTWVAITPADLDALSSTAVVDTMGHEAGVNEISGFHRGMWLVVELADGSTALEDDEICIWTASFKKDADNLLPNGDYKRIAFIRMVSETNP